MSFFNKIFKKQPVRIRQHDLSDCGAACIASISQYYKVKMPIARIRQIAHTTQRGTNVLGVIEAFGQIGFSAKGVKGKWESLEKIPKPAIAHIVLENQLQHYVVIYEVKPTKICVMDPADGRLHWYSKDDFSKIWTGILVICQPNVDLKPRNEKISISQRVLNILSPHTHILLQSIIGAFLFTLLGLTTSIFVEKIVDNVIVEDNLNMLNLLGVAMFVVLGIRIILDTVKDFFVARVGQMIDTSLILGYYRHLLQLPQSFFDNMRSGEIISRINDAIKIRVFINNIAMNLLIDIFMMVASLALIFTYYWKLGALMLIFLPIYAIIYLVANQRNKSQQRKIMESSAELESQLVESVNTISTIKQLNLEKTHNLRTEIKFVLLLENTFKAIKTNIYVENILFFLSNFFTIGLLWVGTYFVLQREISAGELLSFYTLIGYFTSPATNLIRANTPLQDAYIASDRLFEIMDLMPETTKNLIHLTPEKIGNIRIENLDFRYGSRKKVFENLSLIIPKGKFTAFVGESGSGKSTLSNLLLNLYTWEKGNIFLGETEIRLIHPESLRNIISVIPQKIDLFAGNILENITIGDLNPDLPRVYGLSKDLGILEFIEGLPEGFMTYLGENGTTLSGGQRQRIAIARALYRNPKILILDEATSSLDAISETFVHNTLKKWLSEDKNLIVIAHRLNTIASADQIVVFEKGNITGIGTHEELLLSNSNYQNLYNNSK